MSSPPPASADPPELSNEVWQPTPEAAWWRRWSRGWRLAVVLGLAAGGYGVWRGAADYRAVKAWRGRGLAERAGEAAAAGWEEEARRLLDRAGVLAARDPMVLRAIADFAEPRDDVMALYALRQLQTTGQAAEADVQRLVRLAFDWGRPELAPGDVLRGWATQPADGLDVGRLEAGARWLAGRGMVVEAEVRLRQALERAVAGEMWDEARRLNLALGRLLASAATGTPTPERRREAVGRWLAVAQDAKASPRQILEALELAVGGVGEGVDRNDEDEALVAMVRETLAYRLDTAPATTRLGLRLALARLDLQEKPLDGQAVAEDLVAVARESSVDDARRIARWLLKRRFYDQVESLARERLAANPKDLEWQVIQLDTWFGARQWAAVRAALESPDQPLPVVRRRLFLYRVALASEPEGPEREARRTALRDSLRTAQAVDILEVASHLEAVGDRELAVECYRQIQRHERVGLAARLGLVRCLHQQADDGAELIDTLNALLTLWPDAADARADLAYLRLLPPQTPRGDDLTAARTLADDAPQFLGYRMVAALAALREGKAAEALARVDGQTVPWDQVRPGWRALYACVVAANGQAEKARVLAAGVSSDALRPGERELLRLHDLAPES